MVSSYAGKFPNWSLQQSMAVSMERQVQPIAYQINLLVSSRLIELERGYAPCAWQKHFGLYSVFFRWVLRMDSTFIIRCIEVDSSWINTRPILGVIIWRVIPHAVQFPHEFGESNLKSSLVTYTYTRATYVHYPNVFTSERITFERGMDISCLYSAHTYHCRLFVSERLRMLVSVTRTLSNSDHDV